MVMTMSPEFLQWWFSPWANVADSRTNIGVEDDELARRDAYPHWCAQAGVSADFPESCDWRWAEVVTDDVKGLASTARLFMGIIAAGERDQSLLSELPAADRKWCVRVAATQPLSAACKTAYVQTDRMTTRGFVELAARLESDFPGLWSRLSLMIPIPVSTCISELLETGVLTSNFSNSAIVRAQRCWRLCVIQNQLKDENSGLNYVAVQQASAMQETEMENAE